MTKPARPSRILFVFDWLVIGGEETELRLLAKYLDRSRYRMEVVACYRQPNMPEQTHRQLEALGVPVDRTPYEMTFEDKVAYLRRKVQDYDLVVAFQNVHGIYPALESLERRPPLIEHGGLVKEALAKPKHITARYIGVCEAIRAAAASLMPERPHHALKIPSMVDLSEFDASARAAVRAEWGIRDNSPVIGWAGRFDPKKRVEDFIRAAALIHMQHSEARFVVIGGRDSFHPEYADAIRALVKELGLADLVTFTGDRADVPRLLSGLDVFVWLSQGEGMPHVISEAGAAGLPVVATCDTGAKEQITEGVTGLSVEHESPADVAAKVTKLLKNPILRHRLGHNLGLKVEREYSVSVVIRQWERLFDEVIAEAACEDKLDDMPALFPMEPSPQPREATSSEV